MTNELQIFAIALLGSYLGRSTVLPLFLQFCSSRKHSKRELHAALWCALGLCHRRSTPEHDVSSTAAEFPPSIMPHLFWLVQAHRDGSHVNAQMASLAHSLFSLAWLEQGYNSVDAVKLYVAAFNYKKSLTIMHGHRSAFILLSSISNDTDAFKLFKESAVENPSILMEFSRGLNTLASGNEIELDKPGLRLVRKLIKDSIPAIVSVLPECKPKTELQRAVDTARGKGTTSRKILNLFIGSVIIVGVSLLVGFCLVYFNIVKTEQVDAIIRKVHDVHKYMFEEFWMKRAEWAERGKILLGTLWGGAVIFFKNIYEWCMKKLGRK
ncbi:hypothetical protein ADUPG1_000431 [Aduncisulcus paluster]|uniref:Uncharacterized protein n=1 Tax=Aduncisulcus paluster TaxID=2918883 RepID=A0ABQ5K6A5_9EUKA|nr:hypothetical protein ADUPG1_000431 [Aduncisulcus paluster]